MRRLKAWGLAALMMGSTAAMAAGEPVCGLEAHTHGVDCVESVQKLVCALEETAVHIHGEECYILAEGHAHGAECYDGEGVLSCALEEVPAAPVCICPRAEVIPHAHEAACYNEAGELICPLEELQEHSHGEECYETESIICCSLEEHVHDDSCYEMRQAAVSLMEMTILPVEAEPAAVSEAAVVNAEYTAGARTDDLSAVSGDGIRFRLFNYSLDINKISGGSAWRTISEYFAFRDSKLTTGDSPGADIHVPDTSINAAHDADGFTATHATVERVLDGGYPVLDLTRNADGTARTDPGLGSDVRSIAYLFGGMGDHAVSVYNPVNTILQKDGTRYWYNSAQNAVDYDEEAGVFRLRSYAERNSTTAGYGSGYGDFMPFTYTDGQVIGSNAGGTDYHVMTADTDYWYGMTMEVDFFQTKDGLVDGEEMVFNFSGDDDVWVFVDGVLVLDLGGTHGTVDGSINFATGEVRQYLSWGGANATEEAREKGSTTSFPTTIRACFDAAGQTPKGGWNEEGTIFADYTEHTLTFFYLERGAAVANCSLDFRLPTLPDKSLTVTKVLETDDREAGEYLENSLSYAFRVIRAADGELFLAPGTTYDLLSGGVKIGEGTVDEEGLFYLRAGQSAQFRDMLTKGGGAVEYVVQEIMPDNLTGQYSGVEYEVSGQGGETVTEEGPAAEFTAFETDVLSAEETQTVTYRNRVDTARLCRLQITKTAAEGTAIDETERFSIQVKLGDEPLPTGTEYTVSGETRTVTAKGMIELKAGETAVLTVGILSGTTFEVTEPPVAGYTAAYEGTVITGAVTEALAVSRDGAAGTFPLGSTVAVTVLNHSYELPDTGGPGTNLYTGGGLLLTAAGAALLYNRRRREKGTDGSDTAAV